MKYFKKDFHQLLTISAFQLKYQLSKPKEWTERISVRHHVLHAGVESFGHELLTCTLLTFNKVSVTNG